MSELVSVPDPVSGLESESVPVSGLGPVLPGPVLVPGPVLLSLPHLHNPVPDKHPGCNSSHRQTC